jgi:hypothetical protein
MPRGGRQNRSIAADIASCLVMERLGARSSSNICVTEVTLHSPYELRRMGIERPEFTPELLPNSTLEK